MRLTTFTDFGLRALMYIASTPNQSASTAELAREFGLSRHHLVKIVQRLSKGGILSTRRGGGGGATLTRPAEEIRLGDLVRLLEEGQPLVECFLASGGSCSIRGCCRLRHRLHTAEAAFMAELDRSTLADIALPALASGSKAPARLKEPSHEGA